MGGFDEPQRGSRLDVVLSCVPLLAAFTAPTFVQRRRYSSQFVIPQLQCNRFSKTQPGLHTLETQVRICLELVFGSPSPLARSG